MNQETTLLPAPLDSRITPVLFATRMAAQPGQHLHAVARYAENFCDAEQRARRSELKDAIVRAKLDEKRLKKELKRRKRLLDYVPAMLRTGTINGGWGLRVWIGLLCVSLALLALLENFAGATVLLDTGAFGVDSITKGMALLATPAVLGLVVGELAPAAMPERWKRRWFWIALVGTLVCFLVWAYCFAMTGFDALRQLTGLDSGGGVEDVPVSPESAADGDSGASWGLFGASVALMFFNPIVATAGMRALLDSHRQEERNGAHAEAKDEVNEASHELEACKAAQNAANTELARLDADRVLTVDEARAAYLINRKF